MRHARVYEAPPTRQLNPSAILSLSLITALAVALVAVMVVRPNEPARTTGTPLPASIGPPKANRPESRFIAARKLPLGVFAGTDLDSVEDFERWLGRPVQYVVDFSERDTWPQIAEPTANIKEWRGSRYRVIHAVPMLPGTLVATKQKAMRAGAAGEYNRYFELLAEQLVAAGQERAVLRIGWEFNLLGWPWGIRDALTYKKFFRQIATTMRSVPGAKFSIDWNVNNGFNRLDGTEYYPGDSYVDTVGVDVYDLDGTVYDTTAYRSKKCTAACRQTTQQRAWDEVIYGGERGLAFWTEFAALHHKPVALPEWGLWDKPDHTGGGDNALFIEQMHHFISLKSNNVAYASYFDLDSADGRHSLEKSFPKGGQRFRLQFGHRVAEKD
jgi:hypothetical protein